MFTRLDGSLCPPAQPAQLAEDTEKVSLPCVASSCHRQAPRAALCLYRMWRWPWWRPALPWMGAAFCHPHPGDWHAPLTHECQPILTACAGLGQGSGRSLACAVCPRQRNLWMRGGGGAMGCWTPPRVQPLPGRLAPGISDLSYIPSGLLNFIFRIHLLGDPEFSHKSSYSSGPGGRD